MEPDKREMVLQDPVLKKMTPPVAVVHPVGPSDTHPKAKQNLGFCAIAHPAPAPEASLRPTVKLGLGFLLELVPNFCGASKGNLKDNRHVLLFSYVFFCFLLWDPLKNRWTHLFSVSNGLGKPTAASDQ